MGSKPCPRQFRYLTTGILSAFRSRHPVQLTRYFRGFARRASGWRAWHTRDIVPQQCGGRVISSIAVFVAISAGGAAAAYTVTELRSHGDTAMHDEVAPRRAPARGQIQKQIIPQVQPPRAEAIPPPKAALPPRPKNKPHAPLRPKVALRTQPASPTYLSKSTVRAHVRSNL